MFFKISFAFLLLIGCSSGDQEKTLNNVAQEESSSIAVENVQKCEEGSLSDPIKTLFSRAQGCFRKKLYRKSYFIYKSLLSKNLNSEMKSKALNNLAIVQAKLGHFSTAHSLFNQSTALKLSVENVTNHTMFLLNQGDKSIPSEYLAMIKSLDTGSKRLFEIKGRLASIEDNLSAVILNYEKSDLSKGAIENYIYVLFRLGEKKKAFALVKEYKLESSYIGRELLK